MGVLLTIVLFILPLLCAVLNFIRALYTRRPPALFWLTTICSLGIFGVALLSASLFAEGTRTVLLKRLVPGITGDELVFILMFVMLVVGAVSGAASLACLVRKVRGWQISLVSTMIFGVLEALLLFRLMLSSTWG